MHQITPTSSVAKFNYQRDRIRPGMVYHNVKSNTDGTQPINVSIYIATRTHIEVVKLEPGITGQAYVMADMDWETFSADHLDSWHLFPDGILRSQAHSTFRPDTNAYIAYIGDGTFPATIEHLPIHNYNFDFISANLIFPHLIDPETSVDIGIVEPNWPIIRSPDFQPVGVQKHVLRYNGIAHITYIERDTYKGTDCRKYEVAGPGLMNHTGWLWTDVEWGHFVNFEHPHPDNPQWSSFKFELQSIEPMTEGEWNHWRVAECQRVVDLPRNEPKDAHE